MPCHQKKTDNVMIKSIVIHIFCLASVIALCPEHFSRGGLKCYRLVTEEKEFSDAKEACQSMNAILAEPKSEAENKAMYKAVFVPSKDYLFRAWIGIEMPEKTKE